MTSISPDDGTADKIQSRHDAEYEELQHNWAALGPQTNATCVATPHHHLPALWH